MSARYETLHTSALDAGLRRELRALLEDAFDGDFDAHDWDHALGGLHVLAFEDDELIGHASVVQRRLLYAGRALRCGYVEAVAVRADRRRAGHGDAIMQRIEDVVHSAYDLGALSAAHPGNALYRSRGWRSWEGETFALTPSGVVRTADADGGVMVLTGSWPLDVAASLTCDWRDGAVW